MYEKKEGLFLSDSIQISPGIVKNSIISDTSEFAKAVKDTIEKKFNINSEVIIRCAIPEEKSYIQILQIPQVPYDKINQVIQWQSKNLLTFDIKNVYLDTQIIDNKNNRLKILVTASPKNLIDSLIESIKKAGCQIDTIDTRSGALSRVFAVKEHEIIAIAEIQDKIATLIIAKNSI